MRLPPLLRCSICWLAGLACVVRAGVAEPAWRMLETPRFTVFSQLGDAKTRVWAEEFDAFIGELRHMFTAKDSELPPLTIVMFARDRDFTPYKGLRPDGKAPRDIAGFFSRRESWGIVGMADGYETEDTRHLIFHEGVHWYMSANPRKFPVWFEEGVAEVFSTFTQEKNKVHWGDAIPHHVTFLRQGNLLPLERLLFVTRADALFNESSQQTAFYAQSWLFVHYMVFGQRKGERNALDRYLLGLRKGASVDDAFREAFGGDYRAIEAELRRYVQDGKFVLVRRDASAATLDKLPVVPAPAHLVEAARARLAISSRRHELAATHVAKALQLAPDHPAGSEVAALLAWEMKQNDEAYAAAERAEKLGSNDPGTLFLLAYLSARNEVARGGLWGKPAREIANRYRRVIERCPSFEQAYVNLATLVSGLDAVEAADVDMLKQGVLRFPQSGGIALGVAQLVAKAGDVPQAREILDLARNRGLSDDALRFANEVEERWIYQDYTPRIQRLAEERKFAEAIALCDELLPRIKHVQTRSGLIRNRRTLVIQSKVADAEKAAQSGEIERARSLYEEILQSGDLPNATRRHVQERLARLPAAKAGSGDATN